MDLRDSIKFPFKYSIDPITSYKEQNVKSKE